MSTLTAGRSPEELAAEYGPSGQSIRNRVRQDERAEGVRSDGLAAAGAGIASQFPGHRRRQPAQTPRDLPDAVPAGTAEGDILPFSERQTPTRRRGEVRRGHPATIPEPPGPHRRRHAGPDAGVLAGQPTSDLVPEPSMLLPQRHRRPPRRPHPRPPCRRFYPTRPSSQLHTSRSRCTTRTGAHGCGWTPRGSTGQIPSMPEPWLPGRVQVPTPGARGPGRQGVPLRRLMWRCRAEER